MEHIIVKIKTDHFLNSPGYDHINCPLKLALVGMGHNAKVGGTFVTLREDIYDIPHEFWYGERVDEWIEKAKDGENIFISLILTKWKK